METDNLKAFLQLLKNLPSREEFVKSFANVADRVKRFETQLAADFRALAETIKQLNGSIERRFGDLEKKHTDLQERLNARVLSVKDGAPGKDGKDGLDGLPGKDGERGADGSPDTPEVIRDKLSALEGEDRLSIGHIHGLEEALQDGRRIAEQTAIGVQRPGMLVLDISSQLNGSLTTFNTQSFQVINTIFLSSYPNILRPGVDFSTAQQPPSVTFLGTIAANASTLLAAGQTCILLGKG